MNQCIECGKVDEIYDAMEKVVEVAEELVDIAGTDAVTEEVAEVAATLKIMVNSYREIDKRFESRGDENAVQ